MKRLFLLLFSLFFYTALQAQSFDVAKMDSLFLLIESNNKGMGSLSLMQDGEELYTKSIGYADLENQVKAGSQTRYRIGSISKTFTATLIMQLMEEGKLQLDHKLSRFFPEIPNAEQISIEQLLRHRSGLHNFTNDESYFSWMESPQSAAQLLQIFIENGTDFSPGEKTAYSNTNYVLLGMIAEKIEGISYGEMLKNRISSPLSLQDTYYGGKIDTQKQEARSYKAVSGWQPETETDPSVPLGAGGIVSTPSDLNKFFNALFDHRLLQEESLALMKSTNDGIGIGMFQFPFHDKKAYGHTGGLDGFRSVSTYFPEEKLMVSYCANGEAMGVNDILIGVLSIYFDMDYQMPEFSNYALKAEDLDPYLGLYSSPTFPLKVSITREQATLIAQATGQPSFPLEATDEHQFKFDPAQLSMEFVPEEDKLILRQGGGVFELSKEADEDSGTAED